MTLNYRVILLRLFDKFKPLLKIYIILTPFYQETFAQNLISFDFNKKPLKLALLELSIEYDIPIIFPDTAPNSPVDSRCNKCSETEAVISVLSSTSLKWEKNKNQFIVTIPTVKNNFSSKGIIIDSQSGEPIPFANVYIRELNIGDISSQDGTFFISQITSKTSLLSASYIGYETKEVKLNFPNDLDGGSFKNILFKKGKGIVKRRYPGFYFHLPFKNGIALNRPHSAIRINNYKLLKFHDNQELRLYNIDKDISEQNNIASLLPQKTKKMEGELEKYFKEVQTVKWKKGVNWMYRPISKIDSFYK